MRLVIESILAIIPRLVDRVWRGSLSRSRRGNVYGDVCLNAISSSRQLCTKPYKTVVTLRTDISICQWKNKSSKFTSNHQQNTNKQKTKIKVKCKREMLQKNVDRRGNELWPLLFRKKRFRAFEFLLWVWFVLCTCRFHLGFLHFCTCVDELCASKVRVAKLMYDPGSYSNLRENFVNDKYETFTFALILLQYHFITLHKSFSFNWQVGSSGFFKTTEKWCFMFFVFVEFHDRLSGTVVLSLECLLPQWSIRTFFFCSPNLCWRAIRPTPYYEPGAGLFIGI